MVGVWLPMFGCFLFIGRVFTEKITGNNFTFFQNEYTVKAEWGEVVRFNKQYVKHLEVNVYKFNRTTATCNITYTVNWNMGKKLEVIYQAYKFLSNEYRLFPLRFEMNFCTAIENDIAGSRQFYKCGNFTGCSMIKNKRVHICHYVPDSSRFPPHVPNGRFRLDMQGMYENQEVFLIAGYIEIYRPLRTKNAFLN